MQSDASAVPDQGQSADGDSHRPADNIGDGESTGPRGDSSPASVSSASLTCPECGQSFRRREHLIRHLDRHSGRRSYTCDVCKTAFSRRPAPCAKCTSKGRRCVYQPKPGDEVAETIEVAQYAADDATSATHSSPSQQVQPLTPLSSVPLQPWIEPELSWDTLLTSAQFLLPFSPVPSFEPGALADFCFGDAAFATTGQPVDDLGVQNSFGAEVPQRETVEDIHDLIGHDHLTAEEEDILIAENIPHVPPVTEETRLYMIQAVKARLPQQEAQALEAKFPSLRHLDTYMQLYFEHLHPRMPLLHVPTFHTSPETWQLVLAVICLGSRYSQAHHHHDHVLLLQRVAQHMVKVDLRELLSVNVLICAQSHLLFQHSLWLSGEWSIMVEAQFYRNTLVTLCRLFLSRESTLMHTPASTEDMNHAWLQWIQGEAKRRLVHFAYIFEFLYSSFVMLPPLLSAAELQTPVPSADRYWSSSCEEWHLLPPPPPSPTLCVLVSRVGLGDVASASLEQLTRCILLSSASLQLTAEGDLLRAMGLDSSSNTASRPNPARGMVTTLSEKAFDILSQMGCLEALRETDAGGSSNDFALLSRVLAILSFTPLSLLFSYNKWQTTDTGQSNARAELSNTILHNVTRTRRCLYYAAQVLQHFRTTRPATVLDIMGCLVSVLYMVLYVDIIEQQDHDPTRRGSGVETSSAEIIRLDHVVNVDVLNDWLQLRNHKRLHVPGVGFLHNDGSILRLYKEGSRILARGSSISRMAQVISGLLESQAKGHPLGDRAFREL
ncbi:hypothetical protein FMUND_2932 [Fusarium mundagurra]|uniref:C2H2-type domain-containing protein n=1 Tax=Fusarium mundagurra TaxID=1567541 RepID=A0A8H5Z0D0_9HYPO|nr:hypothetical protein FMUND_2932 [Fusarium mundagurra]